MPVTADLLASLDAASSETARMLTTLDGADEVDPDDRREAKRRVIEIRSRIQELIDWLSEVRLEAPRN